MSTRRIDELSYECGWLRGVMQNAEIKLERVRELSYSGDVLAAILGDIINDLKDGRERAPEAAKQHAREGTGPHA